MKKILFSIGAIVLLAAGCAGSQTASVDTNADSGQTAVTPQAQEQTSANAQLKADVKVNNADEAVNLIESNSTKEQSQVSASDDSDLSSSDSAELDSFTGVSNGY